MADDTKMVTPETINFPEDSRKANTDIHNTYIHKTRSGHVIEMSDNNGNEHVTIQHRSGTTLQFQPDGKVLMSAGNGKYEMVFGENRMYITGAHDIVVDGAASMKVKGDYNTTIDGNYNTTVTGDANMVIGGNMNNTVVGDQVLVAKNQTTKIAGNSMHTTEGKTSIVADGGAQFASTSGAIEVESATTMLVKSGEATTLDSGSTTLVKSSGETTLQASSTQITSSSLKHNSKNVGDDHEHTDVTSGSDLTGPPA